MKSKIESGANGRAVAGASAGSRRGVASVGREIERIEIDGGYAVMVGKNTVDEENVDCIEWLKADGSGVNLSPNVCVLTDYANACEKCAAVMRENVGDESLNEFPPPEYPRVVYVRLSASVMGVA